MVLIMNKHKTVHRCVISTKVKKGKQRKTNSRFVEKYEIEIKSSEKV